MEKNQKHVVKQHVVNMFVTKRRKFIIGNNCRKNVLKFII